MQPAALPRAATVLGRGPAEDRRRRRSPSSPPSCSPRAARTTAGRRPRPTAPRSPTASTPAWRACSPSPTRPAPPGSTALAGAQAAWYFGANPAGVPVYDPATGVCVDGIAADGSVNRNCGAESVIHTELSHAGSGCAPAIARAATSLTRTTATDGLTVAEAESGRPPAR